MANELNKRPWVIDTTSGTAFYLRQVRVNHFAYVGYTGAGHAVEVQDKNGKLIMLLTGHADLSPVTSETDVDWVDGMLVPANLSAIFGGGVNLPSGRLLVFIE